MYKPWSTKPRGLRPGAGYKRVSLARGWTAFEIPAYDRHLVAHSRLKYAETFAGNIRTRASGELEVISIALTVNVGTVKHPLL